MTIFECNLLKMLFTFRIGVNLMFTFGVEHLKQVYKPGVHVFFLSNPNRSIARKIIIVIFYHFIPVEIKSSKIQLYYIVKSLVCEGN